MMTIPPIAVGGVGGSGTRVVAAILRNAGIDIGSDLNCALDNLWFTLLFKHRDVWTISDDDFEARVSIFKAAMTGGRDLTPDERSIVNRLAGNDRIQHPAAWLRERADSILSMTAGKKDAQAWGWKEPNTHIVVHRLVSALPGLRYIHVARNGLDMAFSQNQNQVGLWGNLALGDASEITPRRSLKFWRWAHERILSIGKTLEPNFLFLSFEKLCSDPEAGVRTILVFAGRAANDDLVRQSAGLIASPKSAGRHKNHKLADFDVEDVNFVRELGFEVGL